MSEDAKFEDAKFEDGGEAPLRLRGLDPEDLGVISALLQDAVFPASEMTWTPGNRRFAILLNRFRWEDADQARARKRSFERVQSVLLIEDVLKVQSQGFARENKDLVLSVLSLEWTPDALPDKAPAGRLTLHLAGDGAIAIEVENIEVLIKDVTRPYVAPSGKQPDHQ